MRLSWAGIRFAELAVHRSGDQRCNEYQCVSAIYGVREVPIHSLRLDRAEFQEIHAGRVDSRAIFARRTSERASRIINVLSEAQRRARLDLNELQFERRKYRGIAAYGQSKLLMNAFTFELARRLAGTGVTANCLHPGVVATNIWSANPPPLIGKLILAVVKPFMLNSKQGAAVSLYLATSPEVAQVSGEYFVKSKPAKSNSVSRDPKVMLEVWLFTNKMTSLPLA